MEEGEHAHLWKTSGSFQTEAASVAMLDELLAEADLWFVYSEVPGFIAQPRPEQESKSVRIDRILLPKPKLMDLGWRNGAIGIEAKRSGIDLGPALAQAMDYRRSVWRRDSGMSIWLDWVFIWPAKRPVGTLDSVLTQNRIGVATVSNSHRLQLQCGAFNILTINRYSGQIEINNPTFGRKAGSR